MEGTSMKRALVGLGFFIFFLISYNPVQAGIEWAPGIMESRFWINSQGGYFYYPLTADPYADLWSNDHPTAFNEDTLTEFDAPPHDYPGTATLEAKSAGEPLSDGSQVQVYGGITFSGSAGTENHFDADENGMNVKQSVIAIIKKKFTNNESAPITVDLKADLTGTVNFNTINYNYDYYFDEDSQTDPILDVRYYAYYLLGGGVTITEYDPQVEISNTYQIKIDNNNSGGILEDIVIRPSNAGYYYTLTCVLTLETHAKNYHAGALGFQSFALDGPFFVGSNSEPFSGVKVTGTLNSSEDAVESLPWLPLLLLN